MKKMKEQLKLLHLQQLLREVPNKTLRLPGDPIPSGNLLATGMLFVT